MMTYFIYVEENKLNGYGTCPNPEVINYEVTEEIYNDYIENPIKYIWDGETIVINPDYAEQKEQERKAEIARLSLTKREVFLALYRDKGITPEQIKEGLTNPEALIEFEYATEYYRGNPLINLIGQSLGYSSADLDYLFINGSLPERE